MKKFEDIVKESLDKLYDAEEQQPQEPETGNEAGNEEANPEETETVEEFRASDFDDFLQKTGTTVTIKKEGTMPSPIFGNRDSENHNKYRVTMQNKNGRASFVFWDSINNTVNDVPLDKKEALAAFGGDVSLMLDGSTTFEDFKKEMGYDETDADLAQKAFNGCRRQAEKAKRLFDEKQLDELMRLASEY